MKNSNFGDDKPKIRILANTYGTFGIDDALSKDADGIGLLRSEFLCFEKGDLLSEEAQLSAYKSVLCAMAGKPVTIRTLDLGADKQIGCSEHYNEENPALGMRGIRFCLTHPEIFRTQLRALYRASVYGNLGIMFPMITSAIEIDEIKKISEEVKKELNKCSIPYSCNIKTGIMIETPAAAILSDELCKSVDFFSIGTNDLIQYTTACDRQNAELEPFIDKTYRAVLRLIEITVKNAHNAGIPIGICGEIAASTAFTEAFIKMGIDSLSVSPQNIPKLRSFIRNMY